MAANVSWPLLCWLNPFASYGDPRSKGLTFGATLRLQLLLEMCQSRGVWARGSISATGATRAKMLRARPAESCSLRTWAGGHWHFLSKQRWVRKSHKNEFMQKTQVSFYSPRFSQSPNYNFRIQQRLGTLRPFPQGSQIYHKAVLQTQQYGKKHHQSATLMPRKKTE